jgi:uncharacterized protein DUF3575
MKSMYLFLACLFLGLNPARAENSTTTLSQVPTTSASSQAITKDLNQDATRIDFKLNAVYLVFPGIDLLADVNVSDKLTVGPELLYSRSDKSNYKLNEYGVGARSNYNFTGKALHTGLYLGASALYFGAALTNPNTSVSGVQNQSTSGSGFVGSLLFGYQWFFRNGFNMNVGVGWGFSTLSALELNANGANTSTSLRSSGISGILGGPKSEFCLGYVL